MVSGSGISWWSPDIPGCRSRGFLVVVAVVLDVVVVVVVVLLVVVVAMFVKVLYSYHCLGIHAGKLSLRSLRGLRILNRWSGKALTCCSQRGVFERRECLRTRTFPASLPSLLPRHLCKGRKDRGRCRPAGCELLMRVRAMAAGAGGRGRGRGRGAGAGAGAGRKKGKGQGGGQQQQGQGQES